MISSPIIICDSSLNILDYLYPFWKVMVSIKCDLPG